MMAVDMNDPEVIESLTFLCVPKEEKIQTQARAFDPKKNVFIADSKEGYVAAEIIESDGTNATVKTETGVNNIEKIKLNKKKFKNVIKYRLNNSKPLNVFK